MPPDNIRTMDMRLIEDVFEMGSGYVLDFTDRTFAEFFREELAIDIDQPRFRTEGNSKAKRLRSLLRASDRETRARVLRGLWEYKRFQLRRSGLKGSSTDESLEFEALLGRITGAAVAKGPPKSETNGPGPDAALARSLKEKVVELSRLAPQPRGYAFERFLKALFDAHGMGARASFRLVGEQIDGSCELEGETYLLEAKWTDARTDAADLRAFNGKLEDKAAWTRGLFVSNSGFTEDGLVAFGRGKRVVCVDGLDLYEILERGLSLVEALKRKVRRAAESGQPFVRIRDLFP